MSKPPRLLDTNRRTGKRLFVVKVSAPGQGCANCGSWKNLYEYFVAGMTELPTSHPVPGVYCSIPCRRAVNNGVMDHEE